MSGAYEITFEKEIRTRLDIDALRRTAARALRSEDVRGGAGLGVLLTGDRQIRKLNHQYRGVRAPTDVLSFAHDEGDRLAAPPHGPRYVADVAISIETARRQAKQYRLTLQDEVSHLLVHGILHALGYDHEDHADKERMRAREDAILGAAHHH